MQSKFDALQTNDTWPFVPASSNCKPIGCKWVYNVKLKLDGCLKRHKACLVTNGYPQNARLDYFKTFSSLVKPITIQIVLILAMCRPSILSS